MNVFGQKYFSLVLNIDRDLRKHVRIFFQCKFLTSLIHV